MRSINLSGGHDATVPGTASIRSDRATLRGDGTIIPPPSGRIGSALSRLIVAGRRACMWSANGGARPQRAGKAIHWPQEPIRRAASAMRESRSNDLLILARVALQAAIRSEDDLFALLKDTTTPPAFPPPVELALA